MSEEYWTRSPSKMLRIRKGKEKFYKWIPTRLVSRLWGFIHHRRLVFFARPLIFKLYSCIYGVKIEEGNALLLLISVVKTERAQTDKQTK